MKYLSSMKKKLNENWLDEVKDTKKEGVDDIINAEGRLLSKYKDYEGIVGVYTAKPEETNVGDIKDVLKKFYERPPKKLGDLLTDRRHNHDLNECPFCGSPFSPDTLDHFMPKEDWPEFSIFPNNLVPQCKGCAPIKGRKYFCETYQTAIFIHPIYSDLLSKVKFKISIEFDEEDKIPAFGLKIIIPKGLSQEDKAKLSSHFMELKIKKRVSGFCYREYNSWKTKLERNRFDIRIALKQRIDEISKSEISKDWKTSLYQEILGSDDLIDYLNSLNPCNREGLENDVPLGTEELSI